MVHRSADPHFAGEIARETLITVYRKAAGDTYETGSKTAWIYKDRAQPRHSAHSRPELTEDPQVHSLNPVLSLSGRLRMGGSRRASCEGRPPGELAAPLAAPLRV
jgi:hypothetical protein